MGLAAPPPTASGSAPSTPALAREVLERVRVRESGALAALFERYFDEIYSLTYRLLGEKEGAEDATQEVFLKVYRAAHRLDPGRDPRPWLMTIAYNVCRDLWRSRGYRMGRRSTSLDGESGLREAIAAGDPSPAEAALTSERERLVQQALMRLPESLRTVVLMRDYLGLGHDEIARSTATSHAATRKRYSRALATLARMLEEHLK